MSKTTSSSKKNPATNSVQRDVLAFPSEPPRSPLDDLVRQGAQQMLQAAIEAEVEQFLEDHASKTDEQGRRFVVRNGQLPAREITTGAGVLEIQQPRVRDNDPNTTDRVRFKPSIVPQYMRKSPTVEEMVPVLYLLGVSTGDFSEALTALVGDQAKGFSPNTVVRLKEQWSTEYEEWCQRSLKGKHYVYIWADGIHVNVRLGDQENKKQCILVVMGATADGHKELIAVQDGYRESEQSWHEILTDLTNRGLEQPPELAIGDGALGFWAALRKAFPSTREQRCWVHKTANILNDVPKQTQPRMKKHLHEIYNSEKKGTAEQAMDNFENLYSAKFPKAWERLKKDREVLLSFYDFPAEHWRHIRSTNPIESAFATIRLRHRRTKGSGSRRASLAMMFKLGQHAEKRWRRLNGHKEIIHLIQGVKFVDGIKQEAA